jgi:hypothetical protein
VLEELKSESTSKSDLDSIKSGIASNHDDQNAQESKELASNSAALLEELDTL